MVIVLQMPLNKITAVVALLTVLSTIAMAQKDCECQFPNRTLADSLLSAGGYDSLLVLTEELRTSSDGMCNALYYDYRASAFYNQREHDSAMAYYAKERAALLSVCDSSSIVSTLIEDTRCLYRQSKLNEALDRGLLTLSLAEKYNDTGNILEAYSFLALMFNKLEQSEKALYYNRLMRDYAERMKVSEEQAEYYNDVSSNYMHIFQDTKEQKYFDTSVYYTRKAYSIAKALNDRYTLVRIYTKLQSFEYYKQNYPKALKYLDSAKRICKPNIDDNILYTVNGDIAHIYMNQKKYKEAMQYADSCLYYAKRISSYSAVMNAYALIYQCGNRSGNYKRSLEAINDYYVIKDSVESIEKMKAVNELEEKYNRAKNEQTIRELNQQKEISELKIKFLTGGVLSAVLIIIAVFLYYRQQMLKKKNEYLEVEQRLNRSRLNPHLFFNSLTAIQGHALREKDISSVATYLSKQANIMRITLESTYKELVSVEDEVDFLTQYLDTQMLLYKNRFSYKILVDEQLEVDEVALPGMILQPFIENSIEHGFAGIDYMGEIKVTFSARDGGLTIEIRDNGKGFVNTQTDKKYPSRATQIIKDRLFLLNQQYRSKAFYKVDHDTQEQGTVVFVQLPLMYVNEGVNNR